MCTRSSRGGGSRVGSRGGRGVGGWAVRLCDCVVTGQGQWVPRGQERAGWVYGRVGKGQGHGWGGGGFKRGWDGGVE